MAPRIIALAMMLALAGEGDAAAPRSAEYQDTLARAGAATSVAEREALFEAAVGIRRREGLEEIPARIEARRQLGAFFSRKESWADAAAQVTLAVGLAALAGDPRLHLDCLLEQARYQRRSTDPRIAFATVEQARKIILALQLPSREVVESALLQAELMAELEMNREKEEVYEALLRSPDADLLRLEHHRARHTKMDRSGGIFDGRWARVLALAGEAGALSIVAEAHDRLGGVAASNRRFPEAAAHFAAAEKADASLERSGAVWLNVIEAYTAMDDRPAAHAAVERAFALVDPVKEPGRAASLHEARGELRAREGDMAGAYGDLRTANELRRRQNATRQSFPFVRMAPALVPAEAKAAAELAVVRNALREAELERTRLRNRQTAGVATVALLASGLLGLAYAYKRRSAAALALARDAAELRADRTRWQMLRYQLNPHFLFNALSSLGGLVATDPRAAGRVVERLSEFCQLALKGSNEGLRPLAEDLEIIRAYLDIEQAGMGDDLVTSIEVPAEAGTWLVPPLILQPLVENALKYGGQTSPERLELRLTATIDPARDELVLEVANTGRWLAPPPVSRPRAAVGLANVRQRLAQFGAPPDALAITHDAGWVRVTLRLPRIVTAAVAAATP